jgi:hypothetical protein
MALVPLAAICLGSVLAHGLFLVIPRDFWDGALYSALSEDRDWPGTFGPFRDAGYPIHGVYHWLVGSVAAGSMGVAHHAVGLLSLVLSGTGLFFSMLQVSRDRVLSVFVALYFVTHPLFTFMVSTGGNVPTLVSTAAFYGALPLMFAATHRSQWARRGLVVAVAFLLTIAFSWQSYVFYAAVPLTVVFLSETNLRHVKDIRLMSLRGVARSTWLWFALIPVVYVGVNGLLFRQSGNYRAHNTFQGFGALLKTAALISTRSLGVAAIEPWSSLLNWQGVAVALVTFVLIVVVVRRCAAQNDGHSIQPFSLARWALVIFGVGAAPYIFVGKASSVAWRPWPHFDEWNARWFILGVVPLAMLVLALVRGVAKTNAWAQAGVLSLCIAANVASSFEGAEHLLEASIADDALVSSLRSVPQLTQLTHWCVVGAPGRSWGNRHRSYELSALLREARSDTRLRDVFPQDWDDNQSPPGEAPRPKLEVFSTEDEAQAASCNVRSVPDLSLLKQKPLLEKVRMAQARTGAGVVIR